MRVIYRGFEITGPSQFTANFDLGIEIEYGLQNIIVEFSDNATKTVNVILNFLFEAPADYFWKNNSLVLGSDLQLTNIPFNIGTEINMDYVFDSELDFTDFESDFIHNRVIEIKPKS